MEHVRAQRAGVRAGTYLGGLLPEDDYLADLELTTALAKAYASGDEEEGVMVVDSEVVADEVEVVD